MLPKNVTDAEMTDLFSQYGNIKDLQILRGSQQTSKGNFIVDIVYRNGPTHFHFSPIFHVHLACLSNGYVAAGCSFLKYETKEQAMAAIEALNGKHKIEVRDN
jgi:CUG-BP- and ETR3-like factor